MNMGMAALEYAEKMLRPSEQNAQKAGKKTYAPDPKVKTPKKPKKKRGT